MKGVVNPFEPWRPAEMNVPPPLHASRPWRPSPPVRAAVEEPPRSKPTEHPPRPKRPQGRADQPSARHDNSIGEWAILFLFELLVVLGLGSLGWLSVPHLPRSIALCASVWFLAQFALIHRLGWQVRLTCMAAAFALVGWAVWCVPTLHGVSLWTAYRQIEELRVLPAGDVAAYRRGEAARRVLMEEFPNFVPDVRAAEKVWLRRTVDEAIENADRQMKNDPRKAFADLHQLTEELHQLTKELPRLQSYASVREELQTARQRALQACRKAARGD